MNNIISNGEPNNCNTNNTNIEFIKSLIRKMELYSIKQNKKLKVKLAFTKITLGGVIGGLTYLYFTK